MEVPVQPAPAGSKEALAREVDGAGKAAALRGAILSDLLLGDEASADGRLKRLLGLAHRHPSDPAIRAEATAALDTALGFARSGECQEAFAHVAPWLLELTLLHLEHTDDIPLRHTLVRNLFAQAASEHGVTLTQRRNAYLHLERLATLHPSDSTTFTLYSVLRQLRLDLGP